MQTRFKRHQLVRILKRPDPEYIEYAEEGDPNFKEMPIKEGMLGRINILLPNFQYHVAIFDPEDKTKIIAYAPFEEDDLEEVKEE